MWFAITANPLNLKRKEKSKEFFSGEVQIILSAENREELNQKLNETKEKFPDEMKKYLHAGIKILEADNAIQAKKKSKTVYTYLEENGQYKIF